MSTPAQFATKMGRVAKGIQPKSVVSAAALHVKRGVQVQMTLAAPSGRLNVGKAGRRIGVRYDLIPPAKAKVFATGPAHLIERDTKPHRIPRATGKGAKRRGDKRPLFIPGVGFRANVNHPGTKGKHPFGRGVRLSLPGAEKAAAKEYFGVLRKVVG